MEYEVIKDLNDRVIYLCNFLSGNQKNKYVMVVPKTSSQVQVLLALMESREVNKVGEMPFLSDKAVVIPLLSDDVVKFLKTSNSFDWAIRYLGGFFNNSMRNLAKMQKGVNQVFVLNNNTEFSDVNNAFVRSMPGGRLIISDTDLLKKQEVLTNVNNVSYEAKMVDVPVAYPNPSEDFFQEQETKGMTKKLTKKSEPGFVSYVLLGVVIAVASLVFLYMLL